MVPWLAGTQREMAGERKRGGEHGQVRKPQGKDTQAAVLVSVSSSGGYKHLKMRLL